MMTKQAKHRWWRRKRGFCAREGCLLLSHAYLCPEHRAQRNAYFRNWYAVRGKGLRAARRASADAAS